MRSLIFWAIPLGALFAGCANPEKAPEREVEYRTAVRRVTVHSDQVDIAPSYQIVIGSAARVIPEPRKIEWAQPAQKPAVSSRVTTPTNTAPARPAPTAVAPRVIPLTETHFQSGSNQLNAAAKNILDGAVAEINKIKPKEVEIIGHTDSVGSDAYNQKLSERRAEAVYEYLKTKGVSVESIERKGFGEKMPIADNHTPVGRAQNRRAEVSAISD